MIELITATSKGDKHDSYIVTLEGCRCILGCVYYSEKEHRFIYSPNAKGDHNGNYHLAEIAGLIEFLNVGEGNRLWG